MWAKRTHNFFTSVVRLFLALAQPAAVATLRHAAELHGIHPLHPSCVTGKRSHGPRARESKDLLDWVWRIEEEIKVTAMERSFPQIKTKKPTATAPHKQVHTHIADPHSGTNSAFL